MVFVIQCANLFQQSVDCPLTIDVLLPQCSQHSLHVVEQPQATNKVLKEPTPAFFFVRPGVTAHGCWIKVLALHKTSCSV